MHSLGRTYAIEEIREEDIAAIMQKHPTLGAYGFGCFGQYHREYRGDVAAELQESRDQLLGGFEQCSNACDWLSSVVKSKRINKRHSSYGLKHYVERLYKPYACSNGAFILAAIHLGFGWGEYGSAVHFNFDQTSLNRLLITNN